MDYLLLYVLLLFAIGIVVKLFMPVDSGSRRQDADPHPPTAQSAGNVRAVGRPLHSTEDCLDAASEQSLLNEDNAINRLRLKHITHAPNGDRLEDALYLTIDGHIINPSSRSLYRYGIYVAPVRGTSYCPEQDLINADTEPGHRATLVREPSNEHDTNAVIVRDDATQKKIGYVNKLNARRIAKLLDDDPGSLRAIFIRGDAPGAHSSPIWVIIAAPDRLRRLLWN